MVENPRTAAELLQFPTLYPIKVVCDASDGIRARIDTVVRRHVPALQAEQISERPSSAGNFVSITYSITADSAAQIRALLSDILAQPGVRLAI